MIACAPTEKLAVLGFLLSCVGVQKDKVNARGMTGDHHTLLDEPAIAQRTEAFARLACTALHQAAWYGQEEAVRMLLEAGASLDIRCRGPPPHCRPCSSLNV